MSQYESYQERSKRVRRERIEMVLTWRWEILTAVAALLVWLA